LLSENSGIYLDSNSQSKNSLGSVKVHSLTLFCTPGSMKCDSRAPLLAHTFANPCLGCKPKARVAIKEVFHEFKVDEALCIFNFGCNQIQFISFLHISVIKKHYCELKKMKPLID
jgi:hypothetical protein